MVSEFAFDFNKSKKALVLSVKLALNTPLVFTCSNAGIETPFSGAEAAVLRFLQNRCPEKNSQTSQRSTSAGVNF